MVNPQSAFTYETGFIKIEGTLPSGFDGSFVLQWEPVDKNKDRIIEHYSEEIEKQLTKKFKKKQRLQIFENKVYSKDNTCSLVFSYADSPKLFHHRRDAVDLICHQDFHLDTASARVFILTFVSHLKAKEADLDTIKKCMDSIRFIA